MGGVISVTTDVSGPALVTISTANGAVQSENNTINKPLICQEVQRTANDSTDGIKHQILCRHISRGIYYWLGLNWVGCQNVTAVPIR